MDESLQNLELEGLAGKILWNKGLAWEELGSCELGPAYCLWLITADACAFILMDIELDADVFASRCMSESIPTSRAKERARDGHPLRLSQSYLVLQ
jgi:hypothetical protein